jgi:uncharacterized membrane protein YgdD (TMEM256/DUF423 family)
MTVHDHDHDLELARRTLIAAALFGLLGVAAGALGAHGLEPHVTPEQLEWWQTAARYQQIHALALLLVGWGAGGWSAWRSRAAISFAAGMLVFSGTLYAMALGGPRLLGAVTPLGGACLIAGWGLIAVHAATRRS